MQKTYKDYLEQKLQLYKYLYIEDVTEELVARNIKDILDSISVDDIKEMLRNGYGGFMGVGEEAIYKTRFKINIDQLHYQATLNDMHVRRIVKEKFDIDDIEVR
jgi:hypothetical protein